MEDKLIEKDLGGGRAGRMTVRGGLTEFPTFDDEDQEILNIMGVAKDDGEVVQVEEKHEPIEIYSIIDREQKVENKRLDMPGVQEEKNMI